MCRISRRRGSQALTLVEVIIVTAMLSLVALAIYSSFNSGIKVWHRLTETIPVESLDISLEKMTADLRNTFDFSGIKFAGKKDSVSFATLVMTQMGEGKEEVWTIGEVGYSFDAHTETLNRWQATYSELYRDKSASLRQILKNVGSLCFQYYDYDPKQQIYTWNDIWQTEESEQQRNIPLAVRIKIEFGKDAQKKEITRTIALSVGG